MRKLPNEKVRTNGETPSPRFGHTFTMVSKTKGVLFGGAVSMAGNHLLIQANLSSPMKLLFSISLPEPGPNCNFIIHSFLHKELLTLLHLSVKCRWWSMEELLQVLKVCSKMNSIF